MKRVFAITLLIGVIAMNMDMLCQSLCLSGHNDIAGGHASHKMAKHDMPKGDICPTKHNTDHSSHNNIPKTFIKCDCSADNMASIGYELTLAESVNNFQYYACIVSKAYSQEITFRSNEPIPLDNPPELQV